jgi:hypothetical protein
MTQTMYTYVNKRIKQNKTKQNKTKQNKGSVTGLNMQ